MLEKMSRVDILFFNHLRTLYAVELAAVSTYKSFSRSPFGICRYLQPKDLTKSRGSNAVTSFTPLGYVTGSRAVPLDHSSADGIYVYSVDSVSFRKKKRKRKPNFKRYGRTSPKSFDNASRKTGRT